MFRTNQNTGRFAILFLTLWSVWQLMVLHHMLETPHSPDTATRHAVMHQTHSEEKAPNNADGSDTTNPSHDGKSHGSHHCPFLDSITDALGFVTPTVLSPLLSTGFFHSESTTPDSVYSPQQAILDYAPGTSPPTLFLI